MSSLGVGNCTGAETNKWERFNLTPVAAKSVEAPLIRECHANFECRLHDSRMISRYSFFIWEVVHAHVAPTPRRPDTLHYHGEGEFSVLGPTRNRRRQFKPENL